MDVSEITRFKPGSLQQGAAPTEGINVHYLGIFLENDFWTPSPPPPINFVHDHLFFSKFIIIYFFVI